MNVRNAVFTQRFYKNFLIPQLVDVKSAKEK